MGFSQLAYQHRDMSKTDSASTVSAVQPVLVYECAKVSPGWSFAKPLPQVQEWEKLSTLSAMRVAKMRPTLFCGAFSDSTLGFLKYRFKGREQHGDWMVYLYTHCQHKHSLLARQVVLPVLQLTVQGLLCSKTPTEANDCVTAKASFAVSGACLWQSTYDVLDQPLGLYVRDVRPDLEQWLVNNNIANRAKLISTDGKLLRSNTILWRPAKPVGKRKRASVELHSPQEDTPCPQEDNWYGARPDW